MHGVHTLTFCNVGRCSELLVLLFQSLALRQQSRRPCCLALAACIRLGAASARGCFSSHFRCGSVCPLFIVCARSLFTAETTTTTKVLAMSKTDIECSHQAQEQEQEQKMTTNNYNNNNNNKNNNNNNKHVRVVDGGGRVHNTCFWVADNLIETKLGRNTRRWLAHLFITLVPFTLLEMHTSLRLGDCDIVITFTLVKVPRGIDNNIPWPANPARPATARATAPHYVGNCLTLRGPVQLQDRATQQHIPERLIETDRDCFRKKCRDIGTEDTQRRWYAGENCRVVSNTEGGTT